MEEVIRKTPLSFKSYRYKIPDEETFDFENYDIILTTTHFFNQVIADTSSTLCWKRFIYDEPVVFKVSKMKPVMAGFTWFVSSHPEEIVSSHIHCTSSYMYDIVRKMDSSTIKDLSIKNTQQELDASVEFPPVFEREYICFSPYSRIGGVFLTDRVFELIGNNEMHKVIKMVGGLKTTNIPHFAKQHIVKDIERNKNSPAIVSKLQNELINIDERCSQHCVICFDKPTNPVMEFNCKNVFCSNCLLKWKKHNAKCPTCRNFIQFENLLFQVESLIDNEPVLKNKTDVILDIIKSIKDPRIIIYTKEVYHFAELKGILQNNNINYFDLAGNAKTVENNLNYFKKGQYKVLFINSNNEGVGMNFQFITDLICYDNISDLSAPLSKCNRIGRTQSLNVHRLKYETD